VIPAPTATALAVAAFHVRHATLPVIRNELLPLERCFTYDARRSAVTVRPGRVS